MKKFLLLVALATTMATTTTELYSKTTYPIPSKYEGYAVNIDRKAGSWIGSLFTSEYASVSQKVDNDKKTVDMRCEGNGDIRCELMKVQPPAGVYADLYNVLQDNVIEEIKNHVLVGDFKEKFLVKNDDNDKGDIVIIFNVSWKAEDEKNNNIQITTESYYVEDLH